MPRHKVGILTVGPSAHSQALKRQAARFQAQEGLQGMREIQNLSKPNH